MNRDLEIQLIQKCLSLHTQKTTSLSETATSSDTTRYRSAERFHSEMEKLHKALPFPILHSSEITESPCAVATDSPLGKLIISRDSKGIVHTFFNICRHRGAPLLGAGKHTRPRLTCPYHAWSYTNDGQLASVPGHAHCFPHLDKSQNGLLEIPCIEKHGFIWVCPKAEADVEKHLEQHLSAVTPALEWLMPSQLTLFKRHKKVWRGNWKLFLEGSVETYHFSYAHSATIGPYFLNNTTTIDTLGQHLRLVLPTKALPEVAARPIEQQRLRDCSHILYTLFPSDALLVQHNHIDWVQFRPISVDRTEISISTLVPTQEYDSERDYWQRNHDITVAVLDEDFALGEGIQTSMDSGALTHIHYGRNEWALKHVNTLIDDCLGL